MSRPAVVPTSSGTRPPSRTSGASTGARADPRSSWWSRATSDGPSSWRSTPRAAPQPSCGRRPLPRFLSLGERELRAALLLPGGLEPEEPLPVLMDPYGGPHGARVMKSAGLFLTSQWFADHGFAVLVVDGRGVDGRGPAWDREVRFDFAVTVQDQVDP